MLVCERFFGDGDHVGKERRKNRRVSLAGDDDDDDVDSR